MFFSGENVPDFFSSLIYFLLFFFTGYIIRNYLHGYEPENRPEDKQFVYISVFYSLINIGLFSWLFFTWFSPNAMISAGIVQWILFTGSLFATSYITAFLISVVKFSPIFKSWLYKQKLYKWFQKLKVKLSIEEQSLSGSAWNAIFKGRNKVLIIVYLKDRSKPVMGFYGDYREDENGNNLDKAFAGDFLDQHDLYLSSEAMFNLKTKQIDSYSWGIYIPQDQISHLAIIRDIKNKHFLEYLNSIFTGDNHGKATTEEKK